MTEPVAFELKAVDWLLMQVGEKYVRQSDAAAIIEKLTQERDHWKEASRDLHLKTIEWAGRHQEVAAELDEKILLNNELADHLGEAEQQVAALTAERDSFKKDAERYQWWIHNTKAYPQEDDNGNLILCFAPVNMGQRRKGISWQEVVDAKILRGKEGR